MQSFLYRVGSLPATQFREALAQNAASAVNNLAGVPAIGSRRFLIRALSVLAKENFGPEINLFASAVGPTTDPATDSFVARFGFLAALGEQLAAAGLWRYYIDGLAIPYVDRDTVNTQLPPTLHVVLQNLDATGKSAGDAGEVEVAAWLEPMSV